RGSLSSRVRRRIRTYPRHIDRGLGSLNSMRCTRACRLAFILGLIATTGLLLAACGKGGRRLSATAATTGAPAPSVTGEHAPPATTAPKGAVIPPRKAQAIAFANAVNLTAADVPGFKPTPEHESKPKTAVEKQLTNKLLHCI